MRLEVHGETRIATVGLFSFNDAAFAMTDSWRGFSVRTHITAVIVLLCLIGQASGADQRRRIYFLESLSPALPAAVRTIDAFKKRLSETTSEQFEIFVDYMRWSNAFVINFRNLRHVPFHSTRWHLTRSNGVSRV